MSTRDPFAPDGRDIPSEAGRYGPGNSPSEGAWQPLAGPAPETHQQWGQDPHGQPWSTQTYGPAYGVGAVYGQPWAMQPTNPGGFPPPVPWASWGARVGARLLDSLLSTVASLILIVPGLIILLKDTYEVPNSDGTTHLEGFNASGLILAAVGFAVGFFLNLWNLGLRQGKTGQSLGKKVLGIYVVDERTGQPAGSGAGLGRYAVECAIAVVTSCVGFLSILDVLWPLWDDKSQTLHDKAVHTLVINEPTHSRPR